MALYVASITIPDQTPIAAPLAWDMFLSDRYVWQATVNFPVNAAGLAGCQLCSGDSVWAPAAGSLAQWITDDGHPVTWDEDFDLKWSPYHVRIKAYNLDGLRPRTLEIRIVALNFRRTK